MANVILVDSEEKLESLFKKSYTQPVALLKHSNSCGISSHILSQLDEVEGDIHLLIIQQNRSLSTDVAERTGHRHQSPQAFVIKDGLPVYHATHYGIDAEKIAQFFV